MRKYPESTEFYIVIKAVGAIKYSKFNYIQGQFFMLCSASASKILFKSSFSNELTSISQKHLTMQQPKDTEEQLRNYKANFKALGCQQAVKAVIYK